MKKFKITYPWEGISKKCDQENCDQPGYFKAPKSIKSKEKYHFCLEHIKIYNKRWDFFAGKSQKQIYNFLKNDTLPNKPTRPMSERIHSKIHFEFGFDFFKENYSNKNQESKISKKTEHQNALDLFNLSPTFSKNDLKKSYNLLVKKNHPDLNGGNKKKETLLKKINKYYKVLQKIAR